MSLVECKNISRYFGSDANRAHVLKDVNLSMEKGDFVVIIGQSGSGESTLINILGCLDTATSGSYQIDGIETAKMEPDELAALRRERFGFIFQRYSLLGSLTARDNVALPTVYMGTGGKERSARAEKLLQDLGLESKGGNKPSELSDGQQQRVSIARALVNGGEIIFADEPTGALDTASGKNIIKIIQKLHREGYTVIMITHDPGITAIANRIIKIRDGEIISGISKNPKIPESGIECIKEQTSRLFYYDQFMEVFKMSMQAIMAHKICSLLTMLGIIIGIALVVSVVALGNGSQEKILEDINAMGTNTISIFPGSGFGDRRSGRIKTLAIVDTEVIAQQSYVASATPQTTSSGTLTYRNTDLSVSLYGVGEQYSDVHGLKLESGRLFDEADVKEDAQIVVIDQNAKDKLFGTDVDPLGKTVLFKKCPLTVVSVMQKEENSFGNSDVLMLWSPHTTVMHRITGENHTNSITTKIKNDVNTQVAERGLTESLKTRHDTEGFFMNNSDSIKQVIEDITGTMKLLISSIALTSLMVGGISVMNIILMSVTECTKEVGVRMAIGARRNNILQQSLIEAVLIYIIGDLVGVELSMAISLVFNHFVTEFPMEISVMSVIGAVACSTAIGVAFGFMPANHTSRLGPIDALAQG